MEWKVVSEEIKIILRFGTEEKQSPVSSIMISREINKKIGLIEILKEFRDGNLLKICKSEDQKN